MIQVGGPPTVQALSDSKVNLGNPNNPVDATYSGGGTGTIWDFIWTRSSGKIYPTTIADKVSLGTTTFIGSEKLRVLGETNTDTLRTANAYIDTARLRSGIYYANLAATSLTATRTIYLPNKNGTVVLDVDLPANLTLLSTYNQTNANITSAISLSHTHSNISTLNSITPTNYTNWNTAFSWGDWHGQGFLTAETDPIFAASVASVISSLDYTHWTTSYGWGNHALVGYLTVETDPIFAASQAATITDLMIADWNHAFNVSHTHSNQLILDDIIGSGLGDQFLGNDGLYHTISTTAGGTDTQVQFNDGGILAGSAALTFVKGIGTLTVYDTNITNRLYLDGATSYITDVSGDLTFTDTATGSKTLSQLAAGATNYWTATTGGIYYSSYISNHTNPTAELDISGHIIADNFDSNYFRYYDDSLLIGPNLATVGSNKLSIDNTSTSYPLIYGEFDNRLLTFNAEVTLGYGILNFNSGNNQIYEDSGFLYIRDPNINSGTPVTFASFLDGSVNVPVSEFTDLSAVTSITAALMSQWNTAYSQRHIHSNSILLQYNSGSTNYFAPYSSKATAVDGSLYLGTTDPDGTTRLNYNGYFYATKLFIGGSEVTSGLTPADNILDWNSTAYAPYSTQQASLSFDTSIDAPTGTTRLNLNGDLHVTTLDVVGKLTVGGLIDPTGLQLTPVAANPGDANTIWSNSGVSNTLHYGTNKLGLSQLTGLTYNPANPFLFDNSYQYNNYTVSANITPTLSLTGAVALNMVLITFVGDGTHTVDFSNFVESSASGTFDPTLGTENQVVFCYDGYDVYYAISADLKIDNVTTTNRLLGRISSGAGVIEELTGTQATTLLDNFTTALKGLTPASGGGTTNFLRADGTWAAPSTGVTPTDDILDWSTDKYIPYAAQQASLSFDTSATAPTLTTRINLNGAFYATSGTFTNIATNTFGSSTSAIIGVSGAGYAGQFQSGTNITLYVNKSGTLSTNDNTEVLKLFKVHGGTGNSTGDVISITDNPTTSGTISGSVLKATIGTDTRIDMNPRVAASGTSIAYILDTHNTLTSGDNLLTIRNNGNNRFLVGYNGGVTAFGGFYSYSDASNYSYYNTNLLNFVNNSVTRTNLYPGVADGASAVAYMFDTHNALSTSGAKIVSFKNAGTEHVYIDKDGIIYSNTSIKLGASTQLGSSGNLFLSTYSELLPTVSNGSTALAFKLNTQNTLSTAGAKLLSVQNNTVERFRVTPTTTDIVTGASTTFSTVGGTLKDFYTDASTSETDETDLYSYTVPTNVLANNGDKLIAEFTVNSIGATGSLHGYFAGNSLASPTLTSSTTAIKYRMEIFRVSSTTFRYSVYYTVGGGGTTAYVYNEVGSEDWTATNILKITGQCSAGSLTARMGYIEYKPAALN